MSKITFYYKPTSYIRRYVVVQLAEKLYFLGFISLRSNNEIILRLINHKHGLLFYI